MSDAYELLMRTSKQIGYVQRRPANIVNVHGTAEEVKFLCLHSMTDAAADQNAEMIHIKQRYQVIKRSYMRK